MINASILKQLEDLFCDTISKLVPLQFPSNECRPKMMQDQVPFTSLTTWLMQLTMSPFVTLLTDYSIMDLWPSWITPASFRALRVRNFCFTLEKTNSIGLYSGL